MAAPAKIRIASQIEVAWPAARTAPAVCPNCGFAGAAEQLLEIDYRPPDAAHFFTLQVCAACGVRFMDNPETMDYATETLIEIGWHVYQIQLGAGVWPITAPLTCVDKPPHSKILEIGGAYGFGLDFGIRARGWAGLGYDPSPLAAFGATELGLTVIQDYFEAKDLNRGPFDVIVATEVIEHIAHPPAFLKLMRDAVADDGVLILTTPDAAWITPELPGPQLMPLLSPGAHVVLQTAASLRTALAQAGFTHVEIRRNSMSLLAYASPSPLRLNQDPAAGRAMYRNYLVSRSRITAPASDLLLGFAGRGLFEAANDGDMAAADAAWALLVPAVRARFGIDLETIERVPEGFFGLDLAALAGRMPLGLGTILFGRAMQLLGANMARAEIRPILETAVAAVDALQEALAQRSLTDGLSASIRNVAMTEIALCRAEAGDPDSVPALIQITAAEPGPQAAAWRGFVALVNAGAFAPAGHLRDALDLNVPGPDMPADLRQDALKSLANFALRPGGDPALALRHADALRAAGADADADADDILLLAFTRLVNASRYDEALAAARLYDVDALTARPGAAAHDAKLARMVLDLAAGDPAIIPARLAGLKLDDARRETLLLEAFTALVSASRYDEAEAFLTAQDIPALASRAGGDTLRNAQLARTVLDLATGDPAAVPARLAGLTIEPARRAALYLQAFIRLVNARRFEEARDFAETHDIKTLAARTGGDAGSDAGAALAAIALSIGDPASVPDILAPHDLTPGRRDALLFAAFTGLINARRVAEGAALAAAHDIFARLETATGKAADDARIAAIMMHFSAGQTHEAVRRLLALREADFDEALLDALLVDGFIRLVNDSNFEQARTLGAGRAIERRMKTVSATLRADATAALLVLELQPEGQTQRIPQRIEDALRADLPEPRLIDLAFAAFVTLVNRGEFSTARLLTHLVNPALTKLRAPYDAAGRNVLFAAGVLGLQDKDTYRPAAANFARLRDALIRLTPPGAAPDPLFWPALRGEVLALQRLNRGGDATALLTNFLPLYGDAPDDLTVLVSAPA